NPAARVTDDESDESIEVKDDDRQSNGDGDSFKRRESQAANKEKTGSKTTDTQKRDEERSLDSKIHQQSLADAYLKQNARFYSSSRSCSSRDGTGDWSIT